MDHATHRRGSAIPEPSGRPLTEQAALVSLVWPLVPVLIWLGGWVWAPAAIAVLFLLLGLGPLWWLAGLALAIGIGRRTPDPSAPAWVPWAPWLGAVLNVAGLVVWLELTRRGGFC